MFRVTSQPSLHIFADFRFAFASLAAAAAFRRWLFAIAAFDAIATASFRRFAFRFS